MVGSEGRWSKVSPACHRGLAPARGKQNSYMIRAAGDGRVVTHSPPSALLRRNMCYSRRPLVYLADQVALVARFAPPAANGDGEAVAVAGLQLGAVGEHGGGPRAAAAAAGGHRQRNGGGGPGKEVRVGIAAAEPEGGPLGTTAAEAAADGRLDPPRQRGAPFFLLVFLLLVILVVVAFPRGGGGEDVVGGGQGRRKRG